jgi:hypothetical protein
LIGWNVGFEWRSPKSLKPLYNSITAHAKPPKTSNKRHPTFPAPSQFSLMNQSLSGRKILWNHQLFLIITNVKINRGEK